MKPEDSALFTLTELVLASLAVRLLVLVEVVMVVLVEAGVLAVEEGVGKGVHSVD